MDATVTDESRQSARLPRVIQLWRFWLTLAWHDWRRRFRRSLLGAAWLFVSFGLFIAVKILIFGVLSAESMAFFSVWLSTGFLIWTFVQSNLVEGCNVFISSSRWIKAADLPYGIYVLQSVTRSLIQLLLSGLVVLIVLFLFPPPDFWMALTSLLALPILVVNGIWSQVFLGTICARFRDVIHLTQTATRLLFFLTPILWVPESFGEYGRYADYNPFTHVLAIFRDPLIYGTFPVDSWLIVLAITAGGIALSAFTFTRNKHRIFYWV